MLRMDTISAVMDETVPFFLFFFSVCNDYCFYFSSYL